MRFSLLASPLLSLLSLTAYAFPLTERAKTGKLLFVLTSWNHFPNGTLTGYWANELYEPYYLAASDYDITFASPKGGLPPADPDSLELWAGDPLMAKWLADDTAQAKLNNTVKLKSLVGKDKQFDAIFYVGGHGPLFDITKNVHSIALANAFYRSNRPVAAVCHGPAALLRVTGRDGTNIFEGRNATGFTTEEEKNRGLTGQVPFLLEKAMKKAGANFQASPELWGALAVVDGNVVTGQNPYSGTLVANALLEMLRST